VTGDNWRKGGAKPTRSIALLKSRLKSPDIGSAKALSYLDRARDGVVVVRGCALQQAWDSSGADQGKVNEARELLAPVYGWFTEGCDTRDMKEAKALACVI
jgi:hypothetical protein